MRSLAWIRNLSLKSIQDRASLLSKIENVIYLF
jgi:hypothetical protein